MKMPVAKSIDRLMSGATSGRAPHQLWAVWKTWKTITSASAAGLNTFAERVRKTYLLTTAIAEAQAGTYHGSWGLSTIATISPVSMAPLGNSQAPFLLR